MVKMDWLKMVVLAAIWGSSFIFMRILAPVLGAIPTACLRVLIAGSVLFAYFKISGVFLNWKQNARHYLMIGVLNAALPFLFYSFAAMHAPAGLSVMMNSTTPLFGFLFSMIWLSEKMTIKKAVGFLLGSMGVTIIALQGQMQFDRLAPLAALAGLLAAICYALASVYIKKFATQVKPVAMAGMSQLMGGLMLLPLTLIYWSQNPIDFTVITSQIVFCLLGLSLGCSALAFVIFYKLVSQVGPTKALSVGYLLPVFGILWSRVFLHEAITFEMVLGCSFILAGVAIISQKSREQTLLSSILAKELAHSKLLNEKSSRQAS